MTTAGLDAHESGRPVVPSGKPPARAQRRTFTPATKLAVIRECDGADHGQVGAVLRKYGVTRTNLRDWRKQYHEGGMAGLAGKKAHRPDGTSRRVETLERRNGELEAEVAKLRKLVEISGNVYALLGMISEGADSKTPQP